jgi:hypothetical protein
LQREDGATLLNRVSSANGPSSGNSNNISHTSTILPFLVVPTTKAIALVTVYTLAFLYTAQNEVSVRVARAVSRRLKQLISKIDKGEEIVTDEDLNFLEGWRWKILFWGT